MADCNDPGDNGQSREEEWDLKTAVHELNRAAYELAKQSASGEGDRDEMKRQAREMDGFLDELVPRIQAAPLDDQQPLKDAWTDARQDVSYVLSDGQLPTSLRLFHYLEGQKGAKGTNALQ